MVKAFGATAAKAIRTAAGKADSRAKLMGAVRAACARQRISDEDRRAIQLEETGKASLADMSLAEIGKVLDRLNRDWRGPMGHRAYIGKIRALWWTLYWIGAIDEPNDPALEAFIFRQTGKARLPFLGNKEAYKVIEALKAWAAREGVSWPASHDADDDRRAVVRALWTRLSDLRLVRSSGCETYLKASLRIEHGFDAFTARELDAAIRLLGKRIRRAKGEAGADDV